VSDPRRLLDDPSVSASAKDLLGALEAPAPLVPSLRSAIGARVTQTLVAPAAAKLVSAKLAWLVAGAVALGGAGAGAVSWSFLATPPEPQPLVAAARRLPEPPVEPSPEPRAAPPPAQAEPEPSVKAPSVRPARRDTLALEESLLEQARRSSDSPAKALSLLREHERRFPNGELTAERLYLTAQVNARAGNLTGARRAAALLAARFPKSTYLPRVRALLEKTAR